MKMNTGAWIGIGAGIAGMLIAIISVVMTVPGSAAIYITVGMLAVFGGIGFLLFKLLIGPMLNNARLQKTGTPGKAVITEIRDTGVTINNNPQVKLILEVKNNFGQRYTTSCRTIVSRLNPFVFQPGMEIPVKIDPKNEKNVVIDQNVGRSTPATTGNYGYQSSAAHVEQLKGELEKLQQANDVIRLSGKKARAIIKNYAWLGTYVNGDNPYVELDIEILPGASPSFSGKARGVIAAASVEKYQPGKEIWVKYDLYDNSKVAIDHS